MNRFNCLCLMLMLSLASVPVFSQNANNKSESKQPNEKSDESRTDGLKKIAGRSHRWDFEMDDEVVESKLEQAIEEAMKSVEVAMEQMEINLKPMNLNLRSLESLKSLKSLEGLKALESLKSLESLRDLHIEIPDIEPIDIDMPDIDEDHYKIQRGKSSNDRSDKAKGLKKIN